MTDVRTFLEVRPEMKDRLRTAIEALVDVLDSLEPDLELENGGDDELTGDEEPSLGATHAPDQNRAWQATECLEIDAEYEGDSVAECDREPTLGAPEHHPGCHYSFDRVSRTISDDQSLWAGSKWDDRKAPDECEVDHDFEQDVLDEPHDEVDEGTKEPSLGATVALNQEHAWAKPRGLQFEDGEPSLGWAGNGHGHPEAVVSGYDDEREHELTDDNGIGNMDGAYERLPFLNGAGRVE